MSDSESITGRDGQPSLGDLTEAVCDRAEAAWKAGSPLPIEDLLDEVPEPGRAGLFRALLVLELAYRRRGGQRPTAEEYHRRFPQNVGVTESLLGPARPPTPAGADSNLLFGLLAFQNNLIDREALLTAFGAWVVDKSKPLGRILLERGALDADTHALLEGLAKKHIAMHGDDPERSLAALSTLGTARPELEAIADPDLQASLRRVATDPANDDQDPGATRAHSFGRASDAGPRFRVLRFHAKGGLGQVSVARDVELHRDVALKEIQDRFADDPVSRSRFLVEAEITGNLEHPGIIPVYGLGTYADGRPFYAMRFIKGDSLKDAIGQFHAGDPDPKRDPGGRALAFQKLLRRFLDVCYAMAYAHSRGVLHRDLKPDNVMLGPYGETLLVDWGLAKSVGRKDASTDTAERTLRPESEGKDSETRAGSLIGTPAYMSPEQAAGQLDRLGWASDVYSLGATLYCLLTSRSPFDGRDLDALLERVRRGEFPAPRSVNRSIAPALEAVCLKAMARVPEDRYASARALADDLERWLANEPVSVFRDPWRARLKRWTRRHRWAVPAAAVTASLMMLVPSAAFVYVREVAKREAVESKARLERHQDQSKARLERQQALDERNSSEERQQALAGQVDNFKQQIAVFNRSRAVRRDHRPGATNRALTWLREVWRRYPVPGDPLNLRGEIIACLGEVEIGNFLPILEERDHLDHPIRAFAVSHDGKRVAVTQGPFHGIDHVRKVLIGQFDGGVGRPGRLRFEPGSEVHWGRRNSSIRQVRGPDHPGGLLAVARALWSDLVEKLEVPHVLAMSPDGRWLALGASAGTVYLWDLDGDKLDRPPVHWRAHVGGIGSLVFGKDSRSLYSTGVDRVLARWSLVEGPGALPEAGPRHAARSRIGRLIPLDGGKRLFAARDGRLCEFDTETLECRDSGLDLSKYRPDILDVSPDGRFAAVASDAGGEVIALDGGARVRTFTQPGQREEDDPAVRNVSALQFHPSGLLLLETRSGPSQPGRTYLVWEIATGRQVFQSGSRIGEPMSAAFAPDGGHVFRTDHRSGHEQWVLLPHPVVPAQAVETFALTARPPVRVALAPDGATLACLSPTGARSDDRWYYEVTLWSTSDGHFLDRHLLDGVTRVPDVTLGLAFAPGGGQLALVESGGVRIWDLATNGAIRVIETGQVRPLRAFPRDGLLWGTIKAGNDDRLVLLNVDRPGLRQTPFLDGDDRILTGVESNASISIGGGFVLVGSVGGKVEVFREGESPTRVGSWGGLLGVPVWCVAVSPDGKLAAYGNRSGQIQLRRLPAGEVVGKADGHIGVVSTLVFSHDGQRLASGGIDGTLRLWRTEGGLTEAIVLPSATLRSGAVAVGFSPDGGRLWSWGWNMTGARCWRIDKLESALRELGGRLEEVLSGAAAPADAREALELAGLCYERLYYAAAARLYEGAFAADPSLTGNLSKGDRYNAACAAALAGSGRGADAPMPDEAARAALREKARGWLQTDLAAWANQVETGPPEAKIAAEQNLRHWQVDIDLAGVRDEESLGKLPQADRDAWLALWTEVDTMLQKARESPTSK